MGIVNVIKAYGGLFLTTSAMYLIVKARVLSPMVNVSTFLGPIFIGFLLFRLVILDNGVAIRICQIINYYL